MMKAETVVVEANKVGNRVLCRLAIAEDTVTVEDLENIIRALSHKVATMRILEDAMRKF